MDVIYIKKQPVKGQSDRFSYVVSAMAIHSQEGQRLIPHPFGSEVVGYDSLEQAIENIHRAGYDAEFENKLYAVPQRTTVKRSTSPQVTKGTGIDQVMAQAVPFLQDQLQDSSPAVVASAAFALGEIQEERAMTGLIHCFSHDDATVRKNASEAMAKIGRPGLTHIQQALKDANWVVRHSALGAIKEMIHHRLELVPDILPSAMPLLEDDSWLVRSHAAALYGEAMQMIRAHAEKKKKDAK